MTARAGSTKVAIGMAVALALTGCVRGVVGGAVTERIECGGAAIEDTELGALPRSDTLPAEVLGAVDDLGEPVIDRSLDWRVASATDDEVVLLRALDPDEVSGDGDTHMVLTLGPIEGFPDLPDGTWFLWAAGPCSPRLAEGPVGGEADVRLAVPPSPDDTELSLLVMERECASGRSADGRIDLDELRLTETEVRLRVSVRRAPGDQNCPSNPWTPYTIDLGQPIGDRTVVDANLVPPRPLEVGTEEF